VDFFLFTSPVSCALLGKMTVLYLLGPGTSLKKPGTGIGAPTPGVRYGDVYHNGNLV
jgi:hypothetical protein